jgi:hypothetical protein
MERPSFILYLLFFSLFFSNLILAQTEDSSIVLHPIIGDKVDRVEEEYFRLVPAFNNVLEAVFYLNPDSTLNVLVRYEYSGVVKDTFIVNYLAYERLRYYIEHQLAEELNDAKNVDRGKYTNVLTESDFIIAGELLSFSDTSIMILNLDRETYNRSIEPPFDLINVYNSDIRKLTIIEETNIAKDLYPIALGIGFGLAAGIISKEERERAGLSVGFGPDFTPLGYAMLGLGVGYLIGYVLSDIFPIISVSETEYRTPFSEEDVLGIKSITRYYQD